MATRTILVVDDEPGIVTIARDYLDRAGFRVITAGNGMDALRLARTERPSLLVLDLMLPGMDGLDVTRTLRGDPATRTLPIIMLTARVDESDKLVGLEIGADDYVTKPFSPKELAARVTALLRRVTRPPATGGVLRYGSIVIDIDRHTVTVDGEEVRLTAKEFLLLEYLLQHRGRVLSRDLLLTDVWGYQYTGGTRTVDVHIRRLREKMPVLADAIETVKQFGYKLVDST